LNDFHLSLPETEEFLRADLNKDASKDLLRGTSPQKRKSLMSIENKPNGQQTGADIVVKTLEQQNVKWVFGVPGAKIDKVFNTLVDSSIQTP
jgi:hypothetical protein